MVPGDGLKVCTAYRQAAFLPAGKGNRQGIGFLKYQHIFRDDRYERLLVPAVIGYAVELAFYKKRFKFAHAHQVVLHAVEMSVFPDVPHQYREPAVFP